MAGKNPKESVSSDVLKYNYFPSQYPVDHPIWRDANFGLPILTQEEVNEHLGRPLLSPDASACACIAVRNSLVLLRACICNAVPVHARTRRKALAEEIVVYFYREARAKGATAILEEGCRFGQLGPCRRARREDKCCQECASESSIGRHTCANNFWDSTLPAAIHVRDAVGYI